MIALSAHFRGTPPSGLPPRVLAGGFARGIIMLEERHDLCATCAHASACVSHVQLAQRAFECAEYTPQRRPRRTRRTNRGEGSDTTHLKCDQTLGLCSDCENRAHCALRIPEGGVWHCEEYC